MRAAQQSVSAEGPRTVFGACLRRERRDLNAQKERLFEYKEHAESVPGTDVLRDKDGNARLVNVIESCRRDNLKRLVTCTCAAPQKKTVATSHITA